MRELGNVNYGDDGESRDYGSGGDSSEDESDESDDGGARVPRVRRPPPANPPGTVQSQEHCHLPSRRVGQGRCFICAEGGWWAGSENKPGPRHPGPRGSGELGGDHHSQQFYLAR